MGSGNIERTGGGGESSKEEVRRKKNEDQQQATTSTEEQTTTDQTTTSSGGGGSQDIEPLEDRVPEGVTEGGAGGSTAESTETSQAPKSTSTETSQPTQNNTRGTGAQRVNPGAVEEDMSTAGPPTPQDEEPPGTPDVTPGDLRPPAKVGGEPEGADPVNPDGSDTGTEDSDPGRDTGGGGGGGGSGSPPNVKGPGGTEGQADVLTNTMDPISEEKRSQVIGQVILNNDQLIRSGPADEEGLFSPDDIVVSRNAEGEIVASISDEAIQEYRGDLNSGGVPDDDTDVSPAPGGDPGKVFPDEESIRPASRPVDADFSGADVVAPETEREQSVVDLIEEEVVSDPTNTLSVEAPGDAARLPGEQEVEDSSEGITLAGVGTISGLSGEDRKAFSFASDASAGGGSADRNQAVGDNNDLLDPALLGAAPQLVAAGLFKKGENAFEGLENSDLGFEEDIREPLTDEFAEGEESNVLTQANTGDAGEEPPNVDIPGVGPLPTEDIKEGIGAGILLTAPAAQLGATALNQAPRDAVPDAREFSTDLPIPNIEGDSDGKRTPETAGFAEGEESEVFTQTTTDLDQSGGEGSLDTTEVERLLDDQFPDLDTGDSGDARPPLTSEFAEGEESEVFTQTTTDPSGNVAPAVLKAQLQGVGEAAAPGIAPVSAGLATMSFEAFAGLNEGGDGEPRVPLTAAFAEGEESEVFTQTTTDLDQSGGLDATEVERLLGDQFPEVDADGSGDTRTPLTAEFAEGEESKVFAQANTGDAGEEPPNVDFPEIDSYIDQGTQENIDKAVTGATLLPRVAAGPVKDVDETLKEAGTARDPQATFVERQLRDFIGDPGAGVRKRGSGLRNILQDQIAFSEEDVQDTAVEVGEGVIANANPFEQGPVEEVTVGDPDVKTGPPLGFGAFGPAARVRGAGSFLRALRTGRVSGGASRAVPSASQIGRSVGRQGEFAAEGAEQLIRNAGIATTLTGLSVSQFHQEELEAPERREEFTQQEIEAPEDGEFVQGEFEAPETGDEFEQPEVPVPDNFDNTETGELGIPDDAGTGSDGVVINDDGDVSFILNAQQINPGLFDEEEESEFGDLDDLMKEFENAERRRNVQERVNERRKEEGIQNWRQQERATEPSVVSPDVGAEDVGLDEDQRFDPDEPTVKQRGDFQISRSGPTRMQREVFRNTPAGLLQEVLEPDLAREQYEQTLLDIEEEYGEVEQQQLSTQVDEFEPRQISDIQPGLYNGGEVEPEVAGGEAESFFENFQQAAEESIRERAMQREKVAEDSYLFQRLRPLEDQAAEEAADLDRSGVLGDVGSTTDTSVLEQGMTGLLNIPLLKDAGSGKTDTGTTAVLDQDQRTENTEAATDADTFDGQYTGAGIGTQQEVSQQRQNEFPNADEMANSFPDVAEVQTPQDQSTPNVDLNQPNQFEDPFQMAPGQGNPPPRAPPIRGFGMKLPGSERGQQDRDPGFGEKQYKFNLIEPGQLAFGFDADSGSDSSSDGFGFDPFSVDDSDADLVDTDPFDDLGGGGDEGFDFGLDEQDDLGVDGGAGLDEDFLI